MSPLLFSSRPRLEFLEFLEPPRDNWLNRPFWPPTKCVMCPPHCTSRPFPFSLSGWSGSPQTRPPTRGCRAKYICRKGKGGSSPHDWVSWARLTCFSPPWPSSSLRQRFQPLLFAHSLTCNGGRPPSRSVVSLTPSTFHWGAVNIGFWSPIRWTPSPSRLQRCRLNQSTLIATRSPML